MDKSQLVALVLGALFFLLQLGLPAVGIEKQFVYGLSLWNRNRGLLVIPTVDLHSRRRSLEGFRRARLGGCRQCSCLSAVGAPVPCRANDQIGGDCRDATVVVVSTCCGPAAHVAA